MKGALGVVCAALWLTASAHAASPTFPFVFKYDDGTASVTSLSSLLPAPAGQFGFVGIDANGHLSTSAGRQRFFGTNLTYQSNFPSAADAAKVAGRMAKFGINLVRFHHTDYTTAPAGIWTTVTPDRIIDAAQLDKMDRLFYELKQKGIYSNINLTISRPFNYGPTLSTDISLITDGKLRQALAFFDPAVMQLQKDYANSLLTHVNPYTTKAYTNDPALAFIEISNEVGLISEWLGCALDGLPPFYKNELNAQWNAWLVAKYGTFAGLKAAGFGYNQALGSEMLLNPNFTSGTSNWGLDVSGGAAASWAVTLEGPTSNESAKVQITTPGSAAWNVSLFQGNLNVATLTPYTVTFWAKASTARTIAVAVNMNHAPWSGLGFYKQINLTTTWQSFTLGFDLSAADTNARLMFTDLAIPAGTVWISQASMKPGGLVGLYPAENLDTNSMLNFVCNETTLRTTLGRRDWITFLWSLEDAYWTGMRDYIKNTLGAKALLMGTAESFSSANLVAKLDVVDTHAYWQHPTFPSVAWDPIDWYLTNTPMTNAQDNSLGWCNMKRVVGKPWSLSEYNHPRPLTFDGEMAFFMAGYGAFQDYDAVYEFDYESWTPSFDGQKAVTFFQMNQNPVKMATCLPAAAAFLRGDISPATGRIVAALSKASEIDLIRSGGYIPDLAWLGENSKASFVHGVAMATEGMSVPGGSITPGTTALPSVLTSDTGELVWDLSVPGSGFVTLDTARSKWAWGTIGTRTINFAGGFTIAPGATLGSNLGGVALTALDGMSSMLTARTLILTTVGAQTNTGQNYYQYGVGAVAFPPPLNIQLTSKNEWGNAPSIVEGVPATVTTPFPFANVKVWSLTTSGARVAPVTIVNSGGKAQFTVDSSLQALQYEIAVDHAVLQASLTAWPNVNTGSNFKVTLTITNTGTAAATAVNIIPPFALNGSATVNPVAGPSPVMPYATIAAGASVTFTWTYNGAAPGTKTFTVTVTGTDSISGQAINSGQVVSNTITIIDPVALLPSIKVNHFGWRPNDVKIAVVNTNPGGSAVLHRASDGSIAYTIPADGGSIVSKGSDASISGDAAIWQIDFSNFKVEGSYYLTVPSLAGNSYTFDIRENVYNRVGYAMLKSFYAQRCGTAHPAAYMGAGWADAGVCHSSDATAVWNNVDDPGSVNYGTLNLQGGWHDAGDYNKYLGGLDYKPVGDGNAWGGDNGAGIWGIAMGFELGATAFKSDATGIPESGNGVPDCLDEIRWELDWYRKMQTPAAGGAVLSMCHAPAGTFSGGSPPSTDTTIRKYTDPTLESTAIAGACFALGARMFAPYDAAYATTLTTAANSAWTGLPAGDDDSKYWFACELYRMNPAGPNAASAKTYVEGYFNYSNAFGLGSMYCNFGTLPARGNSQIAIRGLMAYTLAPGGTAAVITGMRSQFSQFVTTCFSQAGGYGSGLQAPNDYNWGSNAYVGSRAVSLLHAARIGATGAKTVAEVRTQAENYVHYLLGLNGPNMVYVSNVASIGGEHSSWQFYHGWFGNWTDVDGKAAFLGKPAAVVEPGYPYYAGTDSIGINDNNASTYGPFPGFVPGGANSAYFGGVTPPLGSSGNHYWYRDWAFCCTGPDASGSVAVPWTITENSLSYQGPCVAMVAAFMSPETLLVLSKTASGNPINKDAALTYSLVATSAGGGTAYSVSVWDTVPAGVTFGWATAGGSFDGTKVVWTLPNLAPGATFGVSFTVTVTGVGPVIGPNVASADYRDALAVSQPTVVSGPVLVNVVAGAYLNTALAVSPSSVVEGFGFLVSLTITNSGLAAATDLFASPFAQSGDGSGAFLWGGVPGMPFSLAPGAWVTLTWSFTGSDLGTVRFTATVQGFDAGQSIAIATPVTSPPVTVSAMPGCPLLFNGCEAMSNNGTWSGVMGTRVTTTAYAAAVSQGGAAMRCVVSSVATWADDWATLSGFTPNVWAPYRSLTVDFWADPAALPSSGANELRLAADSPSAGKWYQYFTQPGTYYLSPGFNRITFTLSMTLGSLLPTDPLDNLHIIMNRSGPNPNGVVFVDNMRLTGTMTGGSLAAAGSRPAVSSIGAWSVVTLTVTNTGSAVAIGVMPALAETIGAFRVEAIPGLGPIPPGPVDLLPGQAQTFSWTVSSSGGGLVVFTPTATGSTCGGASISNGIALTMTITGPAAMTAGLNAFPSPRNIGQPFWVTLTVTNTGGATATIYLSSTILIVSGSASSTVAIGPLPTVFPVVLAAGTQRTFTWTLTGATSGTLYLTATVTGRDWLSNAWLGPYVVTSNAMLIQTPAVLTVSAYAYPSPRQAGMPFTVAVTVTNSGEESVNAISFAGPLKSGPGTAVPTGGPAPPTPFTLAGNSATTFLWTYSAATAGWVAYTVTLNGTRANLGTALAMGPRASGSVYIVTPGALDAWVAAGPLNVSVGQTILVSVTVTNTGGTALYNLSSTPITTHSASTADVVWSAGPTPAQSTTLAAGGFVTFTWTFTAVTPGFVIFQADVSATDMLSNAILDTGVMLANGGVQVNVLAGAVLEGSLLTANPAALCVGDGVQLVMTLTNSGASSATAVVPSTSLFLSGSGGAVLFASPRPLTNLGPGGINAVRLTWSYSITSPGTLTFTATVVGRDANSGVVLSTGARWSNLVTALSPGSLSAYLSAPDSGTSGNTVDVVLTVTNTGGQPVDMYDAQLADTDPIFAYVERISGPASAECGGFPCSIAPGATAHFTWSYYVWNDFVAGDVVWSGTAWGTTCGSQDRLGWDTTAPTGAILAAAAKAFPVNRTVGQNILVTLTVTNSGNVPANLVNSGPWVTAGAGAASYVAGPIPAQGGSLAAGAAITFTWTYSAAAPGIVEFSTTVQGTDSVSGQILSISPVVSNTVAILTPAFLDAAVVVAPTPRNTTQTFLVMLTITNTGQAAASGVTLTSLVTPYGMWGTGTATKTASPGGLPIPTLAGGASVTFTWTYTASTAGLVVFGTTVTGTDAVSGLPLNSGLNLSNTLYIQTPAALARQLVIFPGPNRNVGQDFLATLTVTNTGGATAQSLNTKGFLIAGPGAAVYADGPAPPMASFDLPGGATQVFTWTYTGSAAGLVRFSTTVTAVDVNSGAALANVTTSNTILIQTGALLDAMVTLPAASICTGQTIQVRLTVTNNGQASATLLIAEAWEQTGGGQALPGVGPSSATPFVLAGGATRTFTWTFTGSVAGPVTFSTTVSAVDVNAGTALVIGPVASPEITVGVGGALAVAATMPRLLSVGQVYTVSLTVTNTGGTDVTGLTATLYAGPGGGLVGYQSGSVPAGVPALAAGVSQTFVWTRSALGAGVVTFTATGQGTTCGGTALRVGDQVSATIQTAALIRGALSMTPTSMCVGQTFVLTLTVTNSGQADALNVDVPVLPFTVTGGGNVSIVSGPYPPLPATIPGLSTLRFTWTLAGSVAGTAILTTTVSGLDANSGEVKTGLPSVRSVTVGAAGALAALVSGPSVVSAGQWFQVRLTLTNNGGASVTGLTASAFLDSANAAWIAGASPPTVATLNAGSTTTFVWTYSASGSGAVSFSLTAVGSTVCGISIPVIGSGILPVTVQSRAALAAAVAQLSDPVCVGGNYLVTVTLTNTGQAAANSLSLPAPPFRVAGAGNATPAAGPTPALPGSLAGGASVTLTWTFTGAAAGSVALTTTVTGLDANSALPVTTGPATSAAITVNAAAQLAAAAAVSPKVASVGQTLTVTLTVTNTGGADATGVTATLFVGPGGSLAPVLTGAIPAGPQTLTPGTAQTFSWTISAGGSGVVTFTATAAGTTCAAVNVLGAASVSATLQSAATLAAATAVFPAAPCLGQPFWITLTVTNTGQAAATGVTPAPWLSTGTGTIGSQSGPNPPAPVTLSGGSSITFTYTLTASSSGSVSFSTSISAFDQNSGLSLLSAPVLAGPQSLVSAGAVVASVSVGPSPVSIGQWTTVAITVTNTGGSDVTGLTATAFVGPGAALVKVVNGPAGPVTLAAGTAQTLSWTFSAAGAGTAFFTLTATGSTMCGGLPVAVTATGTGALAIQTPAALVGALAVFPGPRVTGQVFLVTLTLTNTGQAAATGLAALAFLHEGTGGGVELAGPAPSLGGPLAGGASVTFTWTFSGSAPGTVILTTTVTGLDANSALVVSTGPVRSNPETIVAPAALAASLAAFPAVVNAGQPFLVTLTVTNTGGAAVNGLTASAFLASGTAGAGAGAGPTPAFPVSLAPGAAVTFTWTESGSSAGTLWFTTTVFGFDTVAASPIVTGPVVSNPVTIQAPAALVASLNAFPSPRTVGQTFFATLTITNTGQATADSVDPAAFVVSGSGAISSIIGPNPAAPVSLVGGTSITFTWTGTASASGSVWLTTTVTGLDATSGALLQIPAVSPVVVIQSPAALTVSVAAFPSPRTQGQPFLVTVTMTNTGGATASGLALEPFLLAGSGAATFAAGPTPALPGSLAGGASLTLTWTYTGSTPGTVVFTTTATATDANTGFAVASGPGVSNAELILPPAALDVSLVAFPATRNVGQSFLVTLTVTNTGGTTILGVTASSFIASGTAVLAAGTGPTPSFPVTLASGAAMTFTWTETGTSAGTVWFTTTVFGTDQVSGNPVTVGPVVSNPVTIQTPAALVAGFNLESSYFPVYQLCPDGSFQVTLTVTNTGQAPATVDGISPFLATGSAAVAPYLGPTPPMPFTLAGGSSVQIDWWLKTTRPGSGILSVTLTGTDLNTGALLTSNNALSTTIDTGQQGLKVTLSHTPAVPVDGGVVRFKILLTNTGTGRWQFMPLEVTMVVPVGFVAVGSSSVSPPGSGGALGWDPNGGLQYWSGYQFNQPGETTTVFLDVMMCGGSGFGFLARAYGLSCTYFDEISTPPDVMSPAPGSPPVSVVASHSPPSPAAGGPVTFRIIATNVSQVSIGNLRIVETLPAGLSFTGQAMTVPGAGFTMWNGATSGAMEWTAPGLYLQPGESATVTINATVCAAGFFAATPWVGATNPCGPLEASDPADAFTVAGTPPLVVSTTHSPAQPGPGGPVTYRILATNTSAATLAGLLIADTLPPGVTFAGQRSAVPNFGFASWNGATAGPLAWQVTGTIYPNQSVTVWVDATACGSGTIGNTAWIGAVLACGLVETTDPTDAFVVAGPPSPAIAVTHAPGQPGPGGPVTYRILATNTTAATLSGLLITDTLPGGVTFAAQRSAVPNFGFASWNGATAGVLAWNVLGTIYPDQSVTVWIDATVCGTGTIGNTVWTGAVIACGPVGSADPSDAFVVAPPALAVSASHEPAQPGAGGPVTYRILATNTTAATLTGLLVTDTLPAGVTFAGQRSAVPNFGFASWNGATTGVLAWNVLGTIYPDQSVTVWIDATVCGTGTIGNTVWTGAVIACGPVEAADPADAFGAAPAALTVSLDHSPAAPAPGGPVTYRIVATNATAATLTGLLITDTLPAGVTFTGQSSAAPNFGFMSWNGATAGVLAWTAFATIYPNESVTVWIAGTVCGTGPIASTGWAGASIACGPIEASDPSDLFTPAGPPMSVALSVTHSPAAPLPGEAVTYLLVMTNTGGATLDTFTVTDTLPAGFSLSSWENDPKLSFYAPLGMIAWDVVPFDDFYPGEVLTATVYGTVACAPASFSNTVCGIGGISCVTTSAQARDDAVVPAPGSLAAAAAAPAVVGTGNVFAVALTVTNTGGSPVAGVTATVYAGPGGALAMPVTGPVPSGPVTLAAGGSQTFLWTYSATAGGAMSFTLTASGTTCGGGSNPLAAATTSVLLETPARLTATLTVSSTLVCVGGPVIATLEVANLGQTAADTPAVAPFVSGLTPVAGPWPPLPGSLAGGASLRFSWTFTGVSAGPAALSTTVTATDALDGGARTTGGVAGPLMLVYAPGSLAAALSAPVQVSAGQPFDARLTVTNTGGADVTVTGLAAGAQPGAGLVTPPGSSAPLPPVTLAPGAAASFVWTFTATGGGPVTFTVTATGSGLCGLVSSAGTADVAVVTPAALAAAVTALPTPRTVGQTFQVAVTVTNTGGATASGFSVAPLLPAGTGVATWLTGPAPAIPPTLAGGASATFVWTYSATALGTVTFTTTATAADANTGLVVTSGTATSNAVSILPPAALDVALIAYAATVNVGQPFLVTLTVTNTGGSDVLDLTASPFIATLATAGSGPSPALPVTLASGATVTFTWTESGGAAGTLVFSTTLFGTDQVSGNPVLVGPIPSNAVTVQSPAALVASLNAFPAQVSVGQTFLATLTITNTGQAQATGLIPAAFGVSGSGGITGSVGPNPAAPVSLSGGTSIAFTWTCTASSSGSVWLTTTVSGTDANDAAVLTVAPIVSPPVTIQSPAVLVASLAAGPTPRTIGQVFQVALTVTNTGQAAAGPLTVPAFVLSGTGSVTYLSGPAPSVPYASLAGGAAVTFVWTYSATAAGTVGFSTTVNGADLNSGAVLSTGPVTTPAAEAIQTPAALTASIAGLPAALSSGQSAVITLTVTNTGQATAMVVDPGVLMSAGSGGLGSFVGPMPNAPVPLSGGASITFTWTVTASTSGSVSLSLTVTGQDGNSAAALTTGPVASSVAAVQTPAALAASSLAFPTTRNTGQTFLVTLTVTNNGQATANGVTPAAFVVSGSGGISGSVGPTPTAPASISGGSSITFTWTCTASSSGLVWLTTTVSGSDANAGWAIAAGPVVSNTVAIQSAALLAGSLAAFPTPRNAGQPFLVTLTVTNAGGATATGLSFAPFRVSGAGGASVSAAPTLPPSLAGGASVSLTWTFTGGPGLGFLDLSVTVAGTDANSLLPVATGPVASATILIQSPAALIASAAVSNTTLCVGNAFLLTVTVTNTGQATATGVAPAAVLVSGSGGTGAPAGPNPAAPVSLSGGASITFTWTVSASSAGSVSLSTTASGTDANLGSAISSFVASASAGLNAPGALVARWSLPAVVVTGQSFTASLTMTNTGGAPLGGVFPALSTGAGVAFVSGPVPAAPVSLSPGAAQTFAWVYSGAAAGSPAFTATVTGTDLCATRSAVASSTVLVQTGASLVSRLAISPDPANIGTGFLVMLTVTNTGQADASGVAAAAFLAAGPGIAALTAGPNPVMPATLAGGANRTFTWTFTGSAPGAFALTTTVTGTDAVSGAGLSSGQVTRSMILTTGAALTAQAAIVPQTVSTGQGITVSFTVSNTAGGNTAINVAPVLVNGSVAGLTPTGTPGPGPFSIAGGAGQTFVWTYNTTSPGLLAFSLTVTAQDSFTLTPLFAAATATGLVESPASLTAGLSLSTTLVYVGNTVLVTVTAANGGQAAASGVLPPALGITGGGVTVLAAPAAVPGAIAGGGSVTWSWTLSAASPATAAFTITVAGTDANSGLSVQAIAVSTLPLRVATLGLTAVRIQATPAALGLDQIVTLILSVSNTGTVTAPGVLPRAVWAGTGVVTPVSGPAPVSALLLPGQTASFTWTYRTMRGGTVSFQAGATASTGAATGTVTSAPVTIQEAGETLADVVVYPDPYRPGDAIGGTLKFRRMPPFTKIRIYTIAAETVAELESGSIGLVEWDGRNKTGARVTPGIYVWVAESKAGERRVGKFQLAP